MLCYAMLPSTNDLNSHALLSPSTIEQQLSDFLHYRVHVNGLLNALDGIATLVGMATPTNI